MGETSFGLEQPARQEPAGVPLQCLRGGVAPADLPGDLQELLALPEALGQRFWDLLAHCLEGNPDAEGQRYMLALCEEHGVEPPALERPLRGARFLVTQAARAAVGKDRFVEDLERLVQLGQMRAILGALLPCYERAMPLLRAAIVARTVSEHGKLVEDVHWRVDKIINSEHGDGVNVPVAVLTFGYREGARQERITLHLLPDQLEKLKEACQQMMP